ncbi:MAG: hypothetical protein RLZZ46_969 [Bacteroidota bacterium]
MQRLNAVKFRDFLILFILLTGHSYGQVREKVTTKPNSVVQRSQKLLVWKDPVKFTAPDGSAINMLNFSGAIFSDKFPGLPVFSSKHRFDNIPSDIQIEILNPEFQELKPDEQACLKPEQVRKLPNAIQTGFSITPVAGKAAVEVFFVPLRLNPSSGRPEKLVSYSTLNVRPRGFVAQSKSVKSRSTYASTSVLKEGTWMKVSVHSDGVYRLDRSFFRRAGIDPVLLDPRNIRIFGTGGGMLPTSNNLSRPDDLIELAISVEGEADGVFDSTDVAWFFAKGPHKWSQSSACSGYSHDYHLYSDSAYYFVVTDQGPGLRINSRAALTEPSAGTVTSFDDYLFYENEAVNLVKSGRQWLGETFDLVTNYNFPFNVPDVDPGQPAFIRAQVAARSRPASNFTIQCQGASLQLTPPEVDINTYFADPIDFAQACDTFVTNGNNLSVNVRFNKAPSYSSAVGYLDYFELVFRRKLKLSVGALIFRDKSSVGVGGVRDFILENAGPSTIILDVSNPLNPVSLPVALNGSQLSFRAFTDTLREYIAFNAGSNGIVVPAYAGRVQNQNLHAQSPVDYIIVSHPDFLQQAERLGNFHSGVDGLSYTVVTPQQIYNEFSGGSQDPTAIKQFMKMLYDRATAPDEKPKYLLLFGDASYDLRNRSTSGNTNFVPSYQSANSKSYINSYVSDDYFGLLDDNAGEGLADEVKVGIGRIPCKNLSEASRVVDKIIGYYSRTPLNQASLGACESSSAINNGDWKNVIVFIADDEDSNLHLNNSNEIASYADTTYKSFNIEKIYLDAYKQQSGAGGKRYPDVKQALNQRVNRGALIVNYVGHGGETGWTEERILEVSDITSWQNEERTPLFVTATCEFSRFDDPARTSAGEEVILRANGGGIGLLTTTRLVYATYNQTLNVNFFIDVFGRDSITGKPNRIGDICRQTKNRSATTLAVNHRNFTLLGDPAIRLKYPTENVRTLTLNSKPIAVSADTMKALSKITISGELLDQNGNRLSNFNGLIYPTVFDKSARVATLGNDPGSPLTSFLTRKNIIYKGKASVENGLFNFSFIVPKDINYQFGKGRISYFAMNENADANGYSEDFIVGGSNPNAADDTQGPAIELFMNDKKFVTGSLTNEDPDLLAVLFDDHGINTVGNGIGHDIVAILDERSDKPINLNDYYQADLNSYQSGSLRYPFYDLADGKHTISLKAWDVYNNSNSSYLEFVVAKSANLALDHVLNYPNPFTTFTRFMFEHNKPCETLDINIQIFTVSGRLIKTLEQVVKCEGFRSESITWDGKDDFGDNIGRGVYVYRLKVTAADGTWADKYEKLVLLK